MTDEKIIEMFFDRDESAIKETDLKYGRYFRYIAMGILGDEDAASEIVSDTYLRAWNTIPPQKPNFLKAYLGKIARRLSINRVEARLTQKRGAGEYTLVLDELSQLISDDYSSEIEEALDLRGVINSFLRSLGDEERRIFIRRYWYFNSVSEISRGFSISESKVKSTLMRVRLKLRDRLIQEGFKH